MNILNQILNKKQTFVVEANTNYTRQVNLHVEHLNNEKAFNDYYATVDYYDDLYDLKIDKILLPAAKEINLFLMSTYGDKAPLIVRGEKIKWLNEKEPCVCFFDLRSSEITKPLTHKEFMAYYQQHIGLELASHKTLNHSMLEEMHKLSRHVLVYYYGKFDKDFNIIPE